MKQYDLILLLSSKCSAVRSVDSLLPQAMMQVKTVLAAMHAINSQNRVITCRVVGKAIVQSMR
jgi:hypothetical protein